MKIKPLTLILSLFILGGPLFASAKKTVSVLYFDDLSKKKKSAWLRVGIADLLITELSQVAGLQVVERTRLNEIMDELKLSQTGMVDEQSAQKTGWLAGADHLVTGSFLVNDHLLINVRLVETQTGKVLVSFTGKKARDSVDALIHAAAAKIAAHFSLAPVSAQRFSYAALKAHAGGLLAMDSGNVDAAQAAFRTVLRDNPDFVAAGSNLALCFQNLKKFRQVRFQREINKLLIKIGRTRELIASGAYRTPLDQWMAGFGKRFPDPDADDEQYYKEMLVIRSNCTTPGQGMWHIMMDLFDAGEKKRDYFGDTLGFKAHAAMSLEAGNEAARDYPNDRFLNEIQYNQIMTYQQLGIYFNEEKDWIEVKARAEDFLQTWPDYRLVEFVEDAYAESLRRLGKE